MLNRADKKLISEQDKEEMNVKIVGKTNKNEDNLRKHALSGMHETIFWIFIDFLRIIGLMRTFVWLIRSIHLLLKRILRYLLTLEPPLNEWEAGGTFLVTTMDFVPDISHRAVDIPLIQAGIVEYMRIERYGSRY